MTELGAVYVDKITGFDGIATAKTEYLNGCISILIQPQSLDEEGKIREGEWFNIQRLISDSEISIGGPGPIPPPMLLLKKVAKMKPWYWPVTSTIYKLILGAVLGAGVTAILAWVWPFSLELRTIIAFAIAILLYLSLVKRDWL